jgi:hypothetical protein
VICHNSLLFAYGEGSAIVKSRHVRAAAAEYGDVVAFSARRLFYASEAARLAARWLSGRGMPLVAGAIVAIVALGAVFALEMDAGRIKGWLLSAESTNGVRPQPQPLPPKLGQALEHSIQMAAALRPLQANPGGQRPISQKPRLLAQPLTTSKSKVAMGKANTVTVSSTTAQTQGLETTRRGLPPLVLIPPGETNAPPLTRALSQHARKTIRYDMNRAEKARRAGRYNNAIWHLERAVALDPDNQVLRGLLSSARTAKAVSATSHASSRSSLEPRAEALATTAAAADRSMSDHMDIVKDTIQQGNVYMQEGDYDSALRTFKVARVMDPDNRDLDDLITRAEKAKAAEAKTLY